MKKEIIITVIIIICLLTIIIGKRYYDIKLGQTRINATIDVKVQKKIDKKEIIEAAEKKRQEAKEIYEKHKGEIIKYSPIGDSLAAGFNASSKESGYVNQFAKLVHRKIGYDVKIQQGSIIPGSGLNDNGLPNANKVITENPDLITVELGTNDVIKGRKQYLTVSQYRSELTKLIKKLKSAPSKPKVIILTTWNRRYLSISYDDVIEQVGRIEKVPVANLQNIWSKNDVKTKKGINTPFGVSDGFHPNDEGHKEIAQIVYKQAYNLLK